MPKGCSVEGCEKPHKARGLCSTHWAARHKKSPKPKPARRPKAITVQAGYSYRDRHPLSPSGQRIAVYTCPKCHAQHLVAWAPVDEHPGLKTTTCRTKTATAIDNGVLVNVLAPDPWRQYEDEPKMPRLVELDRHHLGAVANL